MIMQTEEGKKGLVLLQQDDGEQACSLLFNPPKDTRFDAEVYYELGVLAGRNLVAVSAFISTMTREPDHIGATSALGELLMLAGDNEGAASYADKLVNLLPGNIGARMRSVIYRLPVVPDNEDIVYTSLSALDDELSSLSTLTEDDVKYAPSMLYLAYRYGDHTERLRRYGHALASANVANVKPYVPAARHKILIVMCNGLQLKTVGLAFSSVLSSN
jgi:hypothetical protein